MRPPPSGGSRSPRLRRANEPGLSRTRSPRKPSHWPAGSGRILAHVASISFPAPPPIPPCHQHFQDRRIPSGSDRSRRRTGALGREGGARGAAAATSMFHVKHWRMRRGKGGDALRMRSDGGGNKPRHLERAACCPSFGPQGWRRALDAERGLLASDRDARGLARPLALTSSPMRASRRLPETDRQLGDDQPPPGDLQRSGSAVSAGVLTATRLSLLQRGSRWASRLGAAPQIDAHRRTLRNGGG